MKIFVAGLESSGNHWVRSILSQHPFLLVTGDSFPSDGDVSRHYPVPQDFDVLVVVAREQHCQQLSVLRRGYNKGRESDFSFEKDRNRICELIESAPRVVFVSYDTLLLYRQHYIDNVFEQIGVTPVEVTTDYRDETGKYIRHWLMPLPPKPATEAAHPRMESHSAPPSE